MHGNMHTHPDMAEIASNLEKAANLYDRNMRISSALIVAGTGLVSAGVIIAKLEKAKQRFVH